MPSATFTHSARSAAPLARIYESLQHAATWMGLGVMDEVSEEVRQDGRLISFSWVASVGGSRYKGTALVSAADPGLMVLLLKSAEIEGELEVRLWEESATKSALDVTLIARPRGFLASMFWGRISEALGRGLPARVEEFAAGF